MITCASCGGTVQNLPFVPRKGTKDLLCHRCFGDKKRRDRGMPEGDGVELRYSKFKRWRSDWRPRKGGEEK